MTPQFSLPNLLVLAITTSMSILTSTSRLQAEFLFGIPERLGPSVNSSASDWEQSVASDDLSLYFASDRTGGWDIYAATRSSEAEPWANAMSLGGVVNSVALDGSPDISSDGLTLFFNSERPGGQGDRDIWMTTRPSLTDAWGPPVNLGPVVNSNSFEGWPSISSDGLSLYYSHGSQSQPDLVVSRRSSSNDPWGNPESLGVLGGNADISSDGLALFFATSGSQGGINPVGGVDISVMTRDSVNDPFGSPHYLPAPINTSGDDFSPNLSDDGRTFYFYSRGAIWQTAVVPEPGSVVLMCVGLLALAMARVARRHFG
jgi:Tol biopolymer transport system component